MSDADSVGPKRFEIVEFSEDALHNALSNDRRTATQVASSRQVKYLAQYLKSEQGIKAKAIVVEYNYTDGDYLDDVAAYYVRCFSKYERRCKRIHFFDSEIDESNLLRLISGVASAEELAAFQTSYIGFVVARPLPEAVVGRTVLRTYQPDNGRRNYKATRNYEANLFGIPLTIEKSLAYQEQDTVLAACATVALWSSFQKAAELFGTPAPRPATITTYANEFVGRSRPIPSRGLQVQQILTAIRAVGLEPEVVQAGPDVPLASLLRAYLKFGLPVILGIHVEKLGLHAVALTGYSLESSQQTNHESKNAVPMKGLKISKFYAHDDQVGPFARMWVLDKSAPNPKESYIHFEGWTCPVKGTKKQLSPQVVIIPAYDKIRVTFLNVHKWVARLNDAVLGVFPLDDLEWDIHLVGNNEFKGAIKKDLPVELCKPLLLAQHPRFIWRIRLFVRDAIAMELLADATDLERSMPVYSLIKTGADLSKQLFDILCEPSLSDEIAKLLTEPLYEFMTRSENEDVYIMETLS